MHLLVSALALSLAAMPAAAQWGPTRWGMSVDQVLATVPDAQPLEREGSGTDVWSQHRLATAPWRMGDVPVRAEFYFDPKRHTLSLVRMIPQDVASCAAVEQSLIALHGDPVLDRRDFGSLRLYAKRWVVPASRDRLLYTQKNPIGAPAEYCHVILQRPE